MATKINIDGYNSYSGADIVVSAQLSQINGSDSLSKKCYILGSLQTISISTYQDKSPVRSIGNINAKDYLMGPRSIAGSLVFAVFDRHFAYDIFNDLKEYTGKGVLLTDEIPPLDLTICFANEYGKKSKMVLYGVKMVSEGQVMSINDLFTENTYQFVGTGLENLTPENSVYPTLKTSTKKQPLYINPTSTPFEDVDSSGKGSKFDYTGDVYNPDTSGDSSNKITHVDINQPLTEDDFGTIIVKLNDPNLVEILLTNKYLTDENPIENIYTSDMFDGSNTWNINVPQGSYNLICIDKETKEILETIENLNVTYSNEENSLNDYPLIDAVSDTSIQASINNPEHDTLVLMLDNEILKTEKPNDSQIEFKELIPNTKYKIYSEGPNSQSKISTCTTLLEKTQLKDDFKSFVFYNKNLWLNDLSQFDYNILFSNNNTDFNLMNNIIEHADDDIKYELLLYAIKYQNVLLKSINNDNDINIINNDNLLSPSFETKDNYEYMNFYYVDDNTNKSYYTGSKQSYDTDFTLNNSYNKHFFVYAMDSNNLKSLKYDFYTFNDLENKLEDYKYKSLNYNDYNYNTYKNNNMNMSEDLLETIILKDNNTPVLSTLKSPYVSFNDEKQILYVELDYEELLEEDKTYYICISKKDDMFQHLPVNKIPFAYNEKSMTLDKYHSHILKDSYYFIYIEDSNFNIISNSSIISTYSDNTELDNYNYSSVKYILNKIKSNLLAKYNCSDLIDFVYLSTLSSEDLYIKDIANIFKQELLNEGINSLQYSNLDSIFYDIVISGYGDSIPYVANITYNDSYVTFNESNLNIVVLDFSEEYSYPVKSVISNDNTISLDRSSYYSIIYGINKKTKQKTGFMLKNNTSNKIYLYKLSVKEVL